MTAPSVGRIVHYVSLGKTYGSSCRAAIVTAVVERRDLPAACDLVVFAPMPTIEVRICSQDEETKVAGTWHWPERVS